MGRHPRRTAMVVGAVLAFGTATSAAAAPPEAIAWPDAPPPPPPPAPRYVAPPVTEKEAIRDVLRSDSDIGRRYRQGRGMIIGGAVSLGSAGGPLLTAGILALFAEVESIPSDTEDDFAESDATDTRAVAVGFVLTAGALVAIGLPLVVVGARKRSDAIEDARRRVSLGMGPRGFGLRF